MGYIQIVLFISSFADLKTQAIELAYAEGISSCKYLNAFMQNLSGYKREREGFTFDEQANAYTCSQGAILSYKGEKPCRDYVNYVHVSSAVDCKECPKC